MNKLLISISVLCTCLMTQGHSETYLSDFFEAIRDESLEKEAFPIDKELQKKYQTIAKQFMNKGLTQTNIVTCETLNSGVYVHIGWYVDGFIATALDGAEAGKQIVVLNDSVVGISYDIKIYDGYFTHNYTWAKITSHHNKQMIKTK